MSYHTDPQERDYAVVRAQLFEHSHVGISELGELMSLAEKIHGEANELGLYGVPLRRLLQDDYRLEPRTIVEMIPDHIARPLMKHLHERLPGVENAVDLFAGSGNMLYWGDQFWDSAFGAEASPEVFTSTIENLSRRGFSSQRLISDSWESALSAHPSSTLFIIDPPWGSAFDSGLLDLTQTSPGVPQIVDFLREVTSPGANCWAVLKTSPRLTPRSGFFLDEEAAVHLLPALGGVQGVEGPTFWLLRIDERKRDCDDRA